MSRQHIDQKLAKGKGRRIKELKAQINIRKLIKCTDHGPKIFVSKCSEQELTSHVQTLVALPIQPELEVENIVPVLTDPQILIGKKFTQSWADDTTPRVQNWNGYVSELVTNGNYI